ncbi:MAG: Ig-like domain-containing protein [Clostridia bacterium]|nr:Ig-like domain-containing protein [Clostridia bacterium]
MTRKFRTTAVILLLAMAISIFAGCSDIPGSSSSEIGEPALNMTETVLAVYDTVFLILENPTDAVNDWHIAEGEEFVKLEQTGNNTVQIAGMKEGEAVIHCEFTSGDRNYMLSCTVTVVPRNFTLNPSNCLLEYGQSLNLATYPIFTSKLVWESSDTSVAVVDAMGKVTAVGVGSATITAKIEKKPEINASAAIIVVEATTGNSGQMSIVPSKIETEVGATTKLTANGGSGTYTWKSSNTAKATVTSNGIVSALSTGTVTITATDSSGKSATCKVTIYRAPTSITVSPVSALLAVKETKKFTASVYPEDASKNINWYSSDTSVATVSSSGVVTMLKEGTVTITAKSAYNSVMATATVSTGAKVTGITVDKATLTASVGQAFTLNPVIAPQNAAIRTYSVTIGDTNVVKLSGNEKNSFIAVNPGTTTITFKSDDGSFTATTTVTVQSVVKSAAIQPSIAQVTVGSTTQLSVKVEPEDANAEGTWKISDASIAKIDEKGVVTGLKEGVTSVSYVFKNNSLTVTSVVKVVKGLSLSAEKLELVPGGTATLTVSQADVSGAWSSDKTDVATVDDKGIVTAVSAGTANVTFKPASDSYPSVICPVTVYAATESIELDAEDVYLTKDATHTPKVTILPAGAKQSGKWTVTAGTDIVEISEAGVITAKKTGKATLVFATLDGKTAELRIYVGKRATGVALDKKTAEITVGEQLTLKPVFAPEDAANVSGTWTTSDPMIAGVSASGVVTGYVPGTAKITFTATDGGFKSECTVKVNGHTDKKIVLTYDQHNITESTKLIATPGELVLDAALDPATDNVTYSVMFTTPVEGLGATVSGGKITLKSEKIGSTNVVVLAKSGDKTYSIIFALQINPTPSVTPTTKPTATPTAAPSATPTTAPTATPSTAPTATPTTAPTATPTTAPTATPTTAPTATPTTAPTATPTAGA